MYLFLLVVVFVVYVVRYALRIRRSRLYQVYSQYPPCFKELPLIGSTYKFLIDNPQDALKKIMEMGYNTIKLGGISRLYGFKTFYLVLTDALDVGDALRTISNKDSYFYGFVQVVTGNGSIFVPDSSISKVRRRIIMPSFSPKMLSSYIDTVWQESENMTKELALYAGKGRFAAGIHLGAYSINSILGVADMQQVKKEICTFNMIKQFHRALRLVFDRCTSFWMHPDFLYSFTSNHHETQKLLAIFQNFAKKMLVRKDKLSSYCSRNHVTSDHLNGETDKSMKNSIIDSLLTSQLPQEDILEEIKILSGASVEAGQAIGFTLLLLGQYPEVQDKAYEELLDIFGDSDRPLEKDDLERMPYLDLVIKESLRLYPPIPLIFRRALKEIKLSSGRVIPARSGVVIPIISLHRNPKYWGADAEAFDPDRFLPERMAGIPENAYIPFSCGPRSCVGYKLSSYLVKMGLCAILRKYRIVGEPAPGPVPYIDTKFEITLQSVNGFELELVHRS